MRMVVMPMPADTEPLIFKHLREEVPNPKQREFFMADAKHIGYGGA